LSEFAIMCACQNGGVQGFVLPCDARSGSVNKEALHLETIFCYILRRSEQDKRFGVRRHGVIRADTRSAQVDEFTIWS